ncbi:MAG: hypothetical protein ACT4OO_14355, partial [Nitrospiraceae bacterium]
TKWSHNASLPTNNFGNPTSKLTYKDVGTNIIDLSAKVTFAQRVFVRANYGFSEIGGGRLIDDDFLKQDGGAPTSRTQSNIKGDDVWYVNTDVGLTALKYPGRRGTLDVFVGFQYRREKHVATGVTQVICTAPGTFCDPVGSPPTPTGQPVITNTQTWSSVRVGAQSEFRVTRRLSFEGKAVFIPYTSLSNDDIHHLRNDLLQNPSIAMSGAGIGANFDAEAKLMIVKGLFARVGYRYWWTRVKDGSVTFYAPAGSDTVNLNEFQNIRQGVTFGVSYEF